MKCPLLTMGLVMRGGSWDSGDDACEGEECAWWRKEYPACCIYSIERALWTIAAELGTIQVRMPHGGKVTK